MERLEQDAADKKQRKAEKRRRKKFKELLRNPGVGSRTVHGLMVSCNAIAVHARSYVKIAARAHIV